MTRAVERRLRPWALAGALVVGAATWTVLVWAALLWPLALATR